MNHYDVVRPWSVIAFLRAMFESWWGGRTAYIHHLDAQSRGYVERKCNDDYTYGDWVASSITVKCLERKGLICVDPESGRIDPSEELRRIWNASNRHECPTNQPRSIRNTVSLDSDPVDPDSLERKWDETVLYWDVDGNVVDRVVYRYDSYDDYDCSGLTRN